MPRTKTQDKRNSILDAAARIFADRGLGAPTSAISSAAGIAEGTLFTYFATKDDLLNELYRDIKISLADAMMADFPRKKSVRTRVEHVWNRYVAWGADHPHLRIVLKSLLVWNGLTDASKLAGMTPFHELEATIQEAEREHLVQDLPRQFVEMTLGALAETAMDLIRQDPARADLYRSAGFQMFWNGIARK